MSTFYFLVSLTADLLIIFEMRTDTTIIRYENSVFRLHELVPKAKTKITVLVYLRFKREWSVKTAIKNRNQLIS